MQNGEFRLLKRHRPNFAALTLRSLLILIAIRITHTVGIGV